MPLQGHLPWPLHAWDALAKLPGSPCAHLAGLRAPMAQEALFLLSPAFLPSTSLGPQRGPGLPPKNPGVASAPCLEEFSLVLSGRGPGYRSWRDRLCPLTCAGLGQQWMDNLRGPHLGRPPQHTLRLSSLHPTHHQDAQDSR